MRPFLAASLAVGLIVGAGCDSNSDTPEPDVAPIGDKIEKFHEQTERVGADVRRGIEEKADQSGPLPDTDAPSVPSSED